MKNVKFNYWKINGFGAEGYTDMKNCIGRLIDVNGCTTLLCTEGYALIDINAKQCCLSKGSLVILPYDVSFIPIRVSANFNLRYISIHIGITDFLFYNISSNLWDFIYHSPVLNLSTEQYPLVLNWFTQTSWFINNCNNEYLEDLLKNNFYNLLIGIYNEIKHTGITEITPDIKNHSRKLISKFYILLNRYHTKHRDVKFYADKMNISSDYLYKLMTRTDGITPKAAIERHSILTIKNYLQITDLSVKSIAYELNFEDTSYMCRFFKKMTGISPIQFRNREKIPHV